MARFALFTNGVKVETLDELRENYNINDMLQNFESKALHRWLATKGYEEELKKVESIMDGTLDDSVDLLMDCFALSEEQKAISQQRAKNEVTQISKESCQKTDVDPHWYAPNTWNLREFYPSEDVDFSMLFNKNFQFDIDNLQIKWLACEIHNLQETVKAESAVLSDINEYTASIPPLGYFDGHIKFFCHNNCFYACLDNKNHDWWKSQDGILWTKESTLSGINLGQSLFCDKYTLLLKDLEFFKKQDKFFIGDELHRWHECEVAPYILKGGIIIPNSTEGAVTIWSAAVTQEAILFLLVECGHKQIGIRNFNEWRDFRKVKTFDFSTNLIELSHKYDIPDHVSFDKIYVLNDKLITLGSWFDTYADTCLIISDNGKDFSKVDIPDDEGFSKRIFVLDDCAFITNGDKLLHFTFVNSDYQKFNLNETNIKESINSIHKVGNLFVASSATSINDWQYVAKMFVSADGILWKEMGSLPGDIVAASGNKIIIQHGKFNSYVIAELSNNSNADKELLIDDEVQIESSDSENILCEKSDDAVQNHPESNDDNPSSISAGGTVGGLIGLITAMTDSHK